MLDSSWPRRDPARLVLLLALSNRKVPFLAASCWNFPAILLARDSLKNRIKLETPSIFRVEKFCKFYTLEFEMTHRVAPRKYRVHRKFHPRKWPTDTVPTARPTTPDNLSLPTIAPVACFSPVHSPAITFPYRHTRGNILSRKYPRTKPLAGHHPGWKRSRTLFLDSSGGKRKIWRREDVSEKIRIYLPLRITSSDDWIGSNDIVPG